MKWDGTKIFGKKIGNCHVKKLGGHTCFSDTLRSLDSPERAGGGLQSRFAAPIQSSVYTFGFSPFYKTICQCKLLDMLLFIKEMVLKVFADLRLSAPWPPPSYREAETWLIGCSHHPCFKRNNVNLVNLVNLFHGCLWTSLVKKGFVAQFIQFTLGEAHVDSSPLRNFHTKRFLPFAEQFSSVYSVPKNPNLAFHDFIDMPIYLHPEHYPPHHRHRYHHYQPGWPRQELDQAVQDSLQVKPKPERKKIIIRFVAIWIWQ